MKREKRKHERFKENSDHKENSRFKEIITGIPAVIFILLLFLTLIFSFRGNVGEAFAEAFSSADHFLTASDDVEAVLKDNLAGRNTYINIDGLAARILAIDNLNGCQKMKNDYLSMFENVEDTEGPAKSVTELNNFLKERDIPFLFILAPSSASVWDAEFLPGHGSDSWKNIDSMKEALTSAQVPNIDMNAWFEENGWGTESVFFKTDHHWTPGAALAAAGCTMEYLSKNGYSGYNEDLFDIGSWDITVYPRLLLGSYGARTGAWYVGTDDFPVYMAKFPTDYSYTCLESGSTWHYHDNITDLSYTENPKKDYFGSNPYYTYMYGDYSMRKTDNALGWNDEKILIIGDSFKLPFEYFLTAQFKEVYTIDTRYYTNGSLAEYIADIDPDIVLMCVYEDSFTDERLFTFGTESYLAALDISDAAGEPEIIGDIELAASDSDDNKALVCEGLNPGSYYTLMIDGADISGGEDKLIQMSVCDAATGEKYESRYFESGSDRSQKWVFNTPDEDKDYIISLFAGTSGHAADTSVSVEGITLTPGIVE